MHLIWQLFRAWLAFGAAVITLFVPGLMVWGAFDSWLPSNSPIEGFDSGQVRLLVGASADQRGYVLLPRVFTDWSITTVIKQDGRFTVETNAYQFLIWLAVFVPFMWFGFFRVWPAVFRSSRGAFDRLRGDARL